MLSASGFCIVAPSASVTSTVKLDVPGTVGVPVIFPVVGPMARPAGRGALPGAKDQLKGFFPPLALRVVLYGLFALPALRLLVATPRALRTAILNVRVAATPPASVT